MPLLCFHHLRYTPCGRIRHTSFLVTHVDNSLVDLHLPDRFDSASQQGRFGHALKKVGDCPGRKAMRSPDRSGAFQLQPEANRVSSLQAFSPKLAGLLLVSRPQMLNPEEPRRAIALVLLWAASTLAYQAKNPVLSTSSAPSSQLAMIVSTAWSKSKSVGSSKPAVSDRRFMRTLRLSEESRLTA